MKKFVLISLSALLILAGCSKTETASDATTVVTSFYPIYDFATQVAKGTETQIINLTPAGTEPHDFEPSTKAIASVYNADAFIFNGAELDVWAEKIHKDAEAKGVKTLEMSSLISLLGTEEEGHAEEHHNDEHAHEEDHHDNHHEDEHGHSHGEFDPHFWLDPLNAVKQVEAIAALLSEIDPENATTYNNNAKEAVANLLELDGKYTTALASCELDTTFASHAAFNYLANRYGFKVKSIAGFSPDEEPTAAKLAELSKEVKEKGVKYIFTETLVSPKLAETLAQETGAKTLVFNPIEGLTTQEIDAGKTYLSIMEENLVSLTTALNCSNE